MTPLERLLQEEIPVRPESAAGGRGVWTQQEQDRHWADLCEAMRRPGDKRPSRAPEDSEAAA